VDIVNLDRVARLKRAIAIRADWIIDRFQLRVAQFTTIGKTGAETCAIAIADIGGEFSAAMFGTVMEMNVAEIEL
jgi:hypothetical protein